MKREHYEELRDQVERPPHYNKGKIEAIDYIEDALGKDKFRGYCWGNTLKYLHRHEYKGHALQDLEKARWYLDKLISTYQEDTSTVTVPTFRVNILDDPRDEE